jgi:ABC-type Mn2+/Zn2+ transport system ATPase subunit
MEAPMLVEVQDVVFGYGARAVVQVNKLRLDAGRCLGIFGPNGAGKTTLVRGLCGLLAPMSGKVHRREKLRIGFLPQHRSMELHWPMSGLDAASMAISSRRRFGWIGTRHEGLREMMTRLKVDQLAHRPFAKLSGGQQQRLLLAGALADRPEILILDEPTNGLDVHSRQLLLDALKQAAQDELCIVIISHDQDDLTLCHQIVKLYPAENSNQPTRIELQEVW